MNLLLPIGLLLLASLGKRQQQPSQQQQTGPKPTPPPGATVRRRKVRPVLVRKGKAITAQPLRGDPYAPPKPTVINDTTPVPAAQAPEQAAVDAAMAQVVRDTLAPKAPPPAAANPVQAAPKRKRSPRDAAKSLLSFVLNTGRFGSKKDRPQQIKDAQRDMGLTPDGIIGPKTRAAAAKHGVALPSDQTQPM